MPDFNGAPAGGGSDSALAWFRRTFGEVIGLSSGAPDLVGDQIAATGAKARRTALAELLDRRFVRVADPASGRITFDTVTDDVLLSTPAEGEIDPLLGEVARGYLAPAKAALASVDRRLCLPDICPDDFADTCDQALRTMALVVTEAPRRGNALQISLHLRELTQRLLPALARMLPPDNDDASVVERRAAAAVAVATQAVNACERAIEIHFTQVDSGPIEVFEAVRRCAVHVPYHAQRARRAVQDAGISDCELDAYLVTPVGPAVAGAVLQVPLSHVLRSLELEPTRWGDLIGEGRAEQIDLVQSNAESLLALVERVKGSAVAKRFSLGDAAAKEVSGTLDRSFAYIAGVFRAVAQKPPPPPAPRRGPKATAQAADGPPPPDQQAM